MKIKSNQVKKPCFDGLFFTIFCQNTKSDIKDFPLVRVKIRQSKPVIKKNTNSNQS